MQGDSIPSLQVRDLPEEIYHQISYLAAKDHRSLTQETIVLLKESIDSRMANIQRRKRVLESFTGLGLKEKNLPDPVELIREDRQR